MDDDSLAEQPCILPARMINEYVYCPRFFHLAWSGKETGENDFTVEGKWVHRSVDSRSDELPGAGVEISKRARSVTLVSERLGISAKVDVIETEDGTAVPLEYKRGRPKGEDQPVWEPERVQLAVAALLLREEGFRCEQGEVYFAGSKERVVVPIDDALEETVHRVVREMRVVAADPLPPPPLVDSPKCPACIFVGTCLPDEQNVLRVRSTMVPRRLVPTDDAASPLYVTIPGAYIGKDGDRVSVSVKRQVIETHRMIDVSQLIIYGNASVSSPLIRELMAREVAVSWFSSGGWFSGMAHGLPSKNVELRRRQALLATEVQIEIARAMVRAKILNSRTLLRRNGFPRDESALKELKRFAIRADRASDSLQLLGIEGGAAKLYFSRLNTMVKGDDASRFDFTRRNRRPPTDRINCLLSYVYGLLVRDATAAAFGVGLDPYLGVFHRPRFGRPALALDMIEEFRPLLADSVVIALINNGELHSRDFVETRHAVSLSPGGRRAVLRSYERRLATEFVHPLFKYKVTYRRALEMQARLLAAVMLGEFESYAPVVTR